MRSSPPAVLTAAWLALALVTGCGSASSTTTATGSDTAVRSVMAQWAAAPTLAAECDLVSSGMRFFIGDGDPTHAACVAHGSQVLGTPAPGALVVHSIHTDHGQTLVDASVGSHRHTYYLIPEYGTWKINSIDIREGIGPSAPPAPVYSGGSRDGVYAGATAAGPPLGHDRSR